MRDKRNILSHIKNVIRKNVYIYIIHLYMKYV